MPINTLPAQMAGSGRNKLYVSLALFAISGWLWVGYNLLHQHSAGFSVCALKNITGVPCPSCGTTRSVLAVLKGDINKALWLNPIGIPATAFLILLPVWMLTDMLRRSDSLYTTYKKSERWLHNKPFALYMFFLLLAINWIWNITKFF